MIVSESGGTHADELDYPSWNGQVNEILKANCPGLTVEYFTQLGGGCQAVAFAHDDKLCACITDDCVGIYKSSIKDVWDLFDEDSDAITFYPVVGDPTQVVSAAIALLVCHSYAPPVDAETLGELSIAEEWVDDDWKTAMCEYPGIYMWHKNSSFPHYIKSVIQRAMHDNAAHTTVFHSKELGGWVTLEEVSSKDTAESMIRRLATMLGE